MKTFTKTCLLALVLFFSTSLIAQQSMSNQIGTKAPDKMELIQLNHGPTIDVPSKPSGSSKAVGDDCSTPHLVLALPYNVTHSTVGAVNNYQNTCLNDFDGGEDVVYQITLPTETTIQVTIDPKGTKHTGMALNDDCFDSPSATCLAVATDIWGNGDPYSFIVTLTAGDYWLMIDTWPNPTNIASYDLSIVVAGTAPNDECAAAIEISEVANYFFTTDLATGAPTAGTGGANIWYKYTATFTGNAFIDLCGSLYDTELGVYDACGGSLLEAGTDECDLQSKVLVSVVDGDSYWIEIGGYYDGISADRGDGYLSIYQQENCPVTCTGTPEGEVCLTDINGGCNMASPAFITPVDSVDICGNLWANGGTRDTDWFEVVLTAVSDVTFTVEAEENVVIGLVGQVVPGVAGCENTTDFLSEFELVPACQPGFIEIAFLAPGTYYFFLAPQVYSDLPCPGFDYKANLDFFAVDKGTISGTVTDPINGIAGVTVSADIYSDVTDASGYYSFDVPPGTYDVTANGFAVGYSTEESLGEVVTKDNTTDVDFTLTLESAPVLDNAFGSFNLVKLEWTDMAKGGFKSLAGGLESNNDYTPSTTMDLDFTLSVYSWDFEWADYFSMTFPAGFSINSGTALNGITSTFIGQTITWDGSFYTETFPEEITFSVNVDIAGISGPQSIDFHIEGDDGSEINGAVTVYEDGGSYVPTFNVYRKLGPDGNSNTYIPIAYGVIGNEYFDEIEAGEWCYFVSQILPDKTESVASNRLCATVLGPPCTAAFDYGAVNDPAMNYTLQFEEEVAWFKFEVPYMMDVKVSTCGSNFNTQFAIYEDCADFTGILPVNAFSHVTGGCGTKATENYKYLPDGTYYVAVYGEGGEFGDIQLEITQIQMFCILENWSGYSIYMNPTPSSLISTVLADVADNMIISIRQTPYGIWWPPQNINTIGNISPLLGYKAKATLLDCTVINGTEVANKTVNLPQGASYLPVRVSYPVDITELFSQNPTGNDLLIAYDMHTNEVFWPIGGVYNLTTLYPGTSYLVNMITAGSRTYPAPAKNASPITIPSFEYKQGKTIWNEVKLTGNPHFISISTEALGEIVTGDFIGVFDGNGTCVGVTEITADLSTLYIAANGDDEYTTSKDGLAVGEKMNYKLYRPSTGAEYGLTPTYSSEMPNQDGLFQINGMSRINEFKLGPTAITENQLSNVSIYPNPTNGTLTISGIGNSVEIIVTNAQGQETYRSTVNNNAQLDLSAQPKGIYFIKLMNENSVRIEKVVLK